MTESTPHIKLTPPELSDLEELLHFELIGRDFFERRINARPSDYYSTDGVRRAIVQAQLDASEDRGYQYLARDQQGNLVARVNLSRVRREHFYSGELGYQVAPEENGKGYAAECVRQILSLAFGVHNLARVEAYTRPENPGSVRVLQRNGFSQFGRSQRSFCLAGQWYDVLCFERRVD